MPDAPVSKAKTQGRDPTFDIARGIGMALVIYGHFLEPVFPARPDLGKAFIEPAFLQWKTIYSFHMLLFFVVSGYVNRNIAKKAFSEVLRGSLRLLALAWVVHIIGALTAIAFGYAPDARASLPVAIEAIFDPILLGYYWSIGVLWFLTSLCFVQLLAYGLLQVTRPAVIIPLAIAAGIGMSYLPNYFLLKTWGPGLAMFALGYELAQRRITLPVWLSVPLFIAVIVLAPLNHGCAFSYAETCQNVGPGLFGVWMFAGVYGYLPLFYVTGLLGSLAVVALSGGLARFKASDVLAFMGRRSLDLFIVNGFVAVFLNSYIAQIPWPTLTPLHYIGLFIGIVGIHLIAIMALRPLLSFLDRIAGFIADALTGLAFKRPASVPA